MEWINNPMSRKHKSTKGAFGSRKPKSSFQTELPYGRANIGTMIKTSFPGSIIVPDDIKADVAGIVRSVDLYDGLPGGRCSFRTYCGWMVLHHLGLPVRRAIGGMAYQAGPDPVRDVVGFCGRDWQGCIQEGIFAGHCWLISGNDFVDFSVGDWRLVSETPLYLPGTPDMDPIQWTAPPLPEFFWSDKTAFLTRAPAKELQLGQAWYTGFSGQPPDLDADLEKYMSILTPVTRTLITLCNEHRLKERL
jgi:hypothetical protein